MFVFCVTAFLRCVFFFFKQKTAYEMRISDWSSDVCSSDLLANTRHNLQALFFGFIRKDRADNENRANRQPRFWRFRARTARAAAIYMALAPFEPFRVFAISGLCTPFYCRGSCRVRFTFPASPRPREMSRWVEFYTSRERRVGG